MQAIQSLEIRIDENGEAPLSKQISNQIKQAVARGQVHPGDRLPTIRKLAQTLQVNPGTVSRAYLELEHDNIVVSRRSVGTIVAAKSDDPKISKSRQRHLSNLVNEHILEVLGQGYNPEELESTFSLHLSRWREERLDREVQAPVIITSDETGSRMVIAASHDLALNLLISKLKERRPELNIDLICSGSLGGLIALQEGRADVAGIHLLDEDTGEYNFSYVKKVLPGRKAVVVHLADRVQGLMFLPGNPKGITGLEDLRRTDVVFANRQEGSGTRVLFDLKLRENGIPAAGITGYGRELDTHLAVASAVANRETDTGLGIAAAARSWGLDFLPLYREKYDLVMLEETYRSPALAPLIEMISSEQFRALVDDMGGYDTAETGRTTVL